MAIAKYSMTAMDCEDAAFLADFYSQITGWPINEKHTWRNDAGIVGWTQLQSGDGASIGFQRIENYRAPTWPDGEVPQQEHLDFEVEDLDAAEVELLNIGAIKADHQPGTDFRVFLDPAGHPFCLVKKTS